MVSWCLPAVYVSGPGVEALLRSEGGLTEAEAKAGGPITSLPLSTRRAVLEAVVRPRPGKLELMRHEVVGEELGPAQRQERLMAAFDTALQVGTQTERGHSRQAARRQGGGSQTDRQSTARDRLTG